MYLTTRGIPQVNITKDPLPKITSIVNHPLFYTIKKMKEEKNIINIIT